MGDIALPLAFALGFLGGFKHAFEPDHVIAVSTLLHKEPELRRALRTGVAWGAGHTTTLVAGVLVIGLLRVKLSEEILGYFELPVAIMLLGLGGYALYVSIVHMASLHRHRHDGIDHYHIGVHPHPHAFPLKRLGWQGYAVHGLAGSGALLLLVAATLPSLTSRPRLYTILRRRLDPGHGGSNIGFGPALSSLAAKPDPLSRPHGHLRDSKPPRGHDCAVWYFALSHGAFCPTRGLDKVGLFFAKDSNVKT